LQSKGFGFEVVTNQKDFIAKLADYDEAWIISNKVLDDTTTAVCIFIPVLQEEVLTPCLGAVYRRGREVPRGWLWSVLVGRQPPMDCPSQSHPEETFPHCC
jgi:hypothetical protein